MKVGLIEFKIKVLSAGEGKMPFYAFLLSFHMISECEKASQRSHK